MPDDVSPLPLDGIRVLDLSLLVPGPACTLRLAWMGAEVIKVEPPGGDPARTLYGGVLWDQYGRGKQSVSLNLKLSEDLERALDLARDSDVLVEGFRPGVLDRLGLGYDAVRRRRPDVVYCSIVGFPPGDGDEDMPTHDLVLLAEGGALGMPASWSGWGKPPSRPSIPVADLLAADAATEAILAALLRRERTGRGGRITISILEAVRHAVACRGADAASRPDHLDPANDLYRAADGRFVALAAVEGKFWQALSDLLGLAGDLGTDVSTWDWRRRRIEGERVAGALAAACACEPAEPLCRRLREAGIPAGVVRTPRDALGDGWIAPPLPFGTALSPPPALDKERTAAGT